MNRPVIAVFLAVALLPCAAQVSHNASAGDSPVQAEIAAETVREDVFPKTSARFPGDIIGLPDVEYANIAGYRPLHLDLYTHQVPSKPRPLVIWIHGGGWKRGDSRTSGAFANFPAVLARLAARGYVVAAINYRLSGEGRFPGPIQDVKAAIRFLRSNATRFGIDAARVILWGGSAGGHLAALAATTCGIAEFNPVKSTGRLSERAAASAVEPAVSDCVQGAVIWYGLFDLNASSVAAQSQVRDFLGCPPHECSTIARLASPVTHIDASDPPMLLIHGTIDKSVPPEQSEAMVDRLHRAGVPVETLFIPEVGHGWIGARPSDTRKASLLALQRTFDFIDSIVATKRK